MGPKTNKHAQEAREREASKKEAQQAAAAKAAEDAKWADTDPKALAKEAKRKQEEEKSRLDELKRQEKKALEEADAARFRGKETKEPKTLTQFQIYEQKMQREAQARAMARQEDPSLRYMESWDVQANPNHVLRDEAARAAEEGRDYVSARGVDQALQALSFEASEESKHPKIKALYIAFFDTESDRVKAENPKLKHSQVQQEVWQRWQRSPQNPKNQPRVVKGGDASADE